MFFKRWFARDKRKATRSGWPRFVPYLEVLEKREVLSDLFVTTAADDGAGSLRAAITQSNADGGGDQIYFNIPGGGVQTITLQSALPKITAPVTIDGYGQGATTPHNLATPNNLGAGKGTNANLSVQLTGVSSVTTGLDITAGSGTVIRGLSIFGFSNAGIVIETPATGVQIAGDFLGTQANGAQAASRNGVGVVISTIFGTNIIGGTANADRNLISGNAQQGVLLQGNGNTVENDLIGTTKLGNGSLANGTEGILVTGSNNTIGGTSAETRNVISGNAGNGVDIFGPNNIQVRGNQVIGNYIGTDATGLIADANQQAGVLVNDTDSTVIRGNVIAANNPSKNSQYGGISINRLGGPLYSTSTRIVGNYIGVAADGVTALGNGYAGILVQDSYLTSIGGTTAAERNIIAGNQGDGIVIGPPSAITTVQGNYIGVVGPDGTTAQANTANGVRVTGGDPTIGGTAEGAGNIISGNSGAGVLVNSSGSALIQGNYIGLGADGLTPVGNAKQGVFLDQDKGSTVGGTTAGAGNVISGNQAHAVDILHGNSNDVVQGNRIGTNAAGNAAVANVGVGVLVNGSSNVTIGGTADGAGNLISGNTGGGVDVSGSSNTVVAGNLIGTDVTGQVALGNGDYGVQVENSASGTTIGGTTESARNVISGNVSTVDDNGNQVGGYGVLIAQTAGSTVVLGNFIGTNLDGTAALANTLSGVRVQANQVTIGGTASGAGNVISGNGGSNTSGVAGILVSNVAKAGVTIQGNFLGTNAAGTATLGNQEYGVYLAMSNGVTVGGTAAGAGNVISGNDAGGVRVLEGSGDVVAGNLIGTDASGNSAVANCTGEDPADTGAVFEQGSSNLTISSNTISGNSAQGIFLEAGSNVAIQNNRIGTNQTGSAALGNAGNGIYAEADSFDFTPVTKLTIGGSNTVIGSIDVGNIISGNKGSGIDLNGTKGATIQGNLIGTDDGGTDALGNSGDGIQLGDGDSNVTIGGTTEAQRNIISGNTGNGVSLLRSSATVQGNFIGLGVDGNTKIGNGSYGVLLASNGNTVGAGNVISGNSSSGVEITGNNNLVTNNFIGTTADGAAAAGNAFGVYIDKSSGNTVQSNLISGSRQAGVLIFHGSNNKLLGNTIGLNASGTAALANESGVAIGGGSDNVVGATGGNGNVISGNKDEGVRVSNGASGTLIQANLIGTTKDGNSAVGNGTAGVLVSGASDNTTIGGTAGAGNLISGNDAVGGDGVVVQGQASGTLIQGNNIGLNALGTIALANHHGIVIQDNAANTIVSTNFIGFNTLSGIQVTGSPTNTSIQGNKVGLNADGRETPNLKDGILVQGGSGTNVSGNVVSGNNGNGIEFSGPGVTEDNTVSGNLIGTNSSGTAAVGNGMAGVRVDDLTAQVHSLNILNNTISGNADEGVFITDSDQVSVGGNVIGLNKLGTAALANGASGSFDGVHVTDSSGVTIGGSSASGNVIAGNTRDGIRVDGGSAETLIEGNTIGLLKGAAQVQANAGNGINITGSANDTTIGGTNGTGTNVISGNGLNGVNIDVNTVNTALNDNIIGMDGTSKVGLGNQQDGVHVLGKGVVLSGSLEGSGDWIAGNGGNGIQVSGANASGTVIGGARIGTNGAGTATLANTLDGILVTTGADDVKIGDPDNQAGNLVSGNTKNGIEVTNAAGTLIQGNLVGTDLSGDEALGNTLAGVFLQGTDSVTVGGDLVALRNTISANGQSGIVVADAASTTIGLNNIGTSSDLGLFPLGNTGDGVSVTGTSTDTTVTHNLIAANTGAGVNFGVNAIGLTLTSNTISPALNFVSGGNETGVLVSGQKATIGGITAGQANTIYGNTTAGIDVEATARDVTIQGNFIGTSAHNLTNGGNGTDGVFVQGLATNVIIGGTAAGTGNVISGNKGNGIHLKNVTQTVQITGNWIGTTVQGTGAIGNAGDGVFLEASGNARIQSNTISGNGQNGVELVNGSNGNTVTGNEIGVGADGTTPLGNLGFGVWAHQGGGAASSNNTIGTTASRGLGNVIGFNAEGVVIGDNLTDSSQQDAIEGNSIFGSPILIDLGNLGVPYKPSGTSGPNFLQVIPTLTSATVSDSDLTIKGLLNGTLPNTTYRIEFFAAQPTSQPFRKFLGFINVTTDSNGNVPGGFSDTLKGVGVKDVEVSATATDQNGNTTGFARAITTAPLSSPQSPTPTQSPTPPQSPTSSPPPSSSAPRLSPSQEVVDMALETAAFLLQDNLPALLNLEAFSRFYLGESLPPSSELLSSILSDLSEFGSAAFLGLQLGLDIAGSMHGTTK